MTSRALSAGGLILGLAITLAHCADGGPTQPSTPFRFEVLQGFGTSESPYYNDTPYQSYAYDIDPAGRAVGMAERESPREFFGAALWPEDGKPVSLDANGMVLQVAYGINLRGQVVGVGLCGGRSTACIWEAGQLRNLGFLNYDGPSEPLAINDHGDAAGWLDTWPEGYEHAALWRNGTATDLGTLGGVQSGALDIDNNGRVVGWARPAGDQPTPRHAFLWQDGTMTDLGTLGGEESIAEAINDSGQVVGWLGEIYDKHAFLWQNGGMRLLPGREPSDAIGLNNHGDVVGTYMPRKTDFHAALWRGGVRYDLNDLVGDTTLVLRWATAINDAGVIVGVGWWNRSLREFGWRLTPTGS